FQQTPCDFTPLSANRKAFGTWHSRNLARQFWVPGTFLCDAGRARPTLLVKPSVPAAPKHFPPVPPTAQHDFGGFRDILNFPYGGLANADPYSHVQPFAHPLNSIKYPIDERSQA